MTTTEKKLLQEGGEALREIGGVEADPDDLGADRQDIYGNAETGPPLVAGPESKEKLGQPGVEFSFDTKKILNILLDNPDKFGNYTEDKLSELHRVFENLSSLPEKLEFKPGVTLIVGENGSGKSTLTHAMFMVLQSMQVGRELQGLSGLALDNFITSYTGIDGARDAYFLEDIDGSMSPLAAAVSGCISIDASKGVRVGHYIDFTTLAGREAETRSNAKRNAGVDLFSINNGASSFPSIGGFNKPVVVEKGSHGQNNRAELDRILNGDYGDMQHRAMDQSSNSPIIVIIEEPENGLDPKNHREMIQKLKAVQRTDPNLVLIVNTNSVIGYEDPEIARVSLWEPEKGIHTEKEIEAAI